MNQSKKTSDIIQSDPDILGGVPVFKGTRVPVEVLFDYLRHSSVEEFLKGYPHISKEMVNEVLELAEIKILNKRLPHYENAA